MNRAKRTSQRKVVDLQKGLFCIHYQDAEDQISPPKVVVRPALGHESNVELLLHPDAEDSTLFSPGSSLVVRAARAAQVQIEVVQVQPNGSLVASVRVEKLTQGASRDVNHVRAGPDFQAQAETLQGLRILGHVAGLGDVFVDANEWIAGPSTPLRIEGLAIQWPTRPSDLDLRYAVKTAAQIGAAKMVGLETFAGTRGRALPITGLAIELLGPRAYNAEITAEALFLSAPVLRAVGRRVVLSGPTGREPLVGLRLAIKGLDASEQGISAEVASAAADRSKSTTSPKGTVRVFRGRPKSAPAPSNI